MPIQGLAQADASGGRRKGALNIKIRQGGESEYASPAQHHLRSRKRLHSETDPHPIDSIHGCNHESQLD